MRATKPITLLLVSLSILLLHCKSINSTLEGNWHIVHFEIYDQMLRDTTVLKLTDKDYLRNLRDKQPSVWVAGDSEGVLDSMGSCFLLLKSDSSFILNDVGFLLRTEPGFVIDRQTEGEWRFEEQTNQITLEVMPGFRKMFQVVALRRDSLILAELISPDLPPFSKVILVKQ